MVCSKCKKELMDDMAFCPYCGNKVEKAVCPKCGAPLVADAKFCSSCGYSINSAAPTPTVKKAATTKKKPAEPFYKTWIAEHPELAEEYKIKWISEFKGDYAVAIFNDNNMAIVKQSYTPYNEISGKYYNPYTLESFDEKKCLIKTLGYCVEKNHYGHYEECFESYDSHCEKKDTGYSHFANGCFDNGLKYFAFFCYCDKENYCVKQNDKEIEGERLNFVNNFLGNGLSLNIDEKHSVYGYALFDFSGKTVMTYADVSIYRFDWNPLITLYNDNYCMKYDCNFEKERGCVCASYSIVDINTRKVLGKDLILRKADKKYDKFRRFYYDAEFDSEHCVLFNTETGKIYRSDKSKQYSLITPDDHDNKDAVYSIMEQTNKDENNLWDSSLCDISLIDGKDKIKAKFNRCFDDVHLFKLNCNEYSVTKTVDTENDIKYTHIWCLSDMKKVFTATGFCDISFLKLVDSSFIVVEYVEVEDGSFYSLLLDNNFTEIGRVSFKCIHATYGFHAIGNEIYSVGGKTDKLGREIAEVTKMSTGESFTVLAEMLVSSRDISIYFGTYCEWFHYTFGSITAFGEPYFLLRKPNCSDNEGGCALVDKHGRYIIPYSEDIIFISQHSYLPANTFFVYCKDDIGKVYDVNGTLIAQDRLDSMDKMDKLGKKCEGCKVR